MHPLILRPRALFYRTDCTRRFKFLTHALVLQTIYVLNKEILQFLSLKSAVYDEDVGQPDILVTLPTTLMGGFSFGVIDGMVTPMQPWYLSLMEAAPEAGGCWAPG